MAIATGDDLKQFTMRMPRDVWLFLKADCAQRGISMSSLILYCVNKHKSKLEKAAKNKETNI